MLATTKLKELVAKSFAQEVINIFD